MIQETVTDYDSLIMCDFHILHLMLGRYQPDRPLIVNNRALVENDLPKTVEAEIEYKRRSMEFHHEVKGFRDTDPLEPHLARVNYCLASIYLSNETFMEVGFEKLKEYVQSNILEKAVQCLEQNVWVDEACKTLLLASEAALVHP